MLFIYGWVNMMQCVTKIMSAVTHTWPAEWAVWRGDMSRPRSADVAC